MIRTFVLGLLLVWGVTPGFANTGSVNELNGSEDINFSVVGFELGVTTSAQMVRFQSKFISKDEENGQTSYTFTGRLEDSVGYQGAAVFDSTDRLAFLLILFPVELYDFISTNINLVYTSAGTYKNEQGQTVNKFIARDAQTVEFSIMDNSHIGVPSAAVIVGQTKSYIPNK